MKSVFIRVKGQIISNEGINVLNLQEFNPDLSSNNLIFLRFAFVTRGKGGDVFPAFILDDWGREINGLRLYKWVRLNGEQFPRGEIFGFEQDGQETQCFLRELELFAKLPVYAYESKDQPINNGILLQAILLSHELNKAPIRIKPPQDIQDPLQSAQVNWWQVPKEFHPEAINFLNTTPNPGY